MVKSEETKSTILEIEVVNQQDLLKNFNLQKENKKPGQKPGFFISSIYPYKKKVISIVF